MTTDFSARLKKATFRKIIGKLAVVTAEAVPVHLNMETDRFGI